MGSLFTNLVQKVVISRKWTENGPIHSRQLFAVLVMMLWVKLVNLVNFVMQFFKWTKWTKWTAQIFDESAESAKSARSIFATFASANFVGKASCESTVRYREWSRIPSTCLRYASVIASTRIRLVILICLCMLTVGVGDVWGAKITYTFSTKGWKASPANWTSGKDGNAFTANQGIQVTSGASGANGTSPSSFTGISKIEVQYCTNASSGKGTIKVKVGSGTEKSFSVSKPSSGGQTLKTATFNFSPVETGNVKVTGECSSNSVYIWSVTIYYQTTVTLNKNSGLSDGSAKFQHDATTYVTSSFTPVTRSGYDCTGYWTASSGGTKILNADGTRAANVSGWWVSNKWAKEDATATLYAQWEAAAMYTITLMDDGDTRTQASAGAAVTLPSRTGCTGYTFAGWTKSWGTAQTTWTTTAPTIIPAGSYTPSADENLYPVYTKTESGDPVETKTQTFQYDTWTYGGSSTDKSSYRLFHTGGYVESASNVDFSKLSKVIVYGGTFGGGENNGISIKKADGTVWKNATVSGASQTGTNEITGGASLTGSAKLRVYSTCGTASGTVSGVRISKVEVYTMEDGSTTYYISVPDCCTPLGSINGSVSWSNPTQAVVTWDKLDDQVSAWALSWSPNTTGSSITSAIADKGSTQKTATVSGLACGTEYTFTLTPTIKSGVCTPASNPTIESTSTKYSITKASVTGGSFTTKISSDAVTSACNGSTISIAATPSTGYTFSSWTITNDDNSDADVTSTLLGANSTTASTSFTMPSHRVTITPSFSCIEPVIGKDPASASYTEGASPSALTVAATLSSGTLTYKWQKSTNSGVSWTDESGTGYNTATYAAANISTSLSANGVQYRCIVGNSEGGCTVTSGVATITVTVASKCVAPTFDPVAGTYNSSQTVTISSSTSGSTIYYTTNGDEPTTSSSHGTEGEASASVTVSSSLTLKAIAYKGGMTTSDVSDAAYVICSTDPSFSTTSSSNITITGARVTCAGITKGTCDIDAYGIVYGTSEHPTGNAQQKGTDASTNVSSYYVDLTGLTAATTYYARPYATVNGKTVYGTEISFTTLHIPEITVSVTSRAFGTRKVAGSYEMTFTVSGEYLQSNIGLAISGTNEAMFSIDKTSLTPSTGTVESTTITVTYTPSAAGSHSATVSITSTNATTKTVTLSGTGQYEDTYMTAMHEGVDAWEDYATGVTQAGTGYDVPNPGDIEAGDREGTGCEGIHYHFAGWVEESYKASPSGHIVAASGTKDASNKTFWAVWEKEAAGGAGAPVNTVLWAEDFSGWGDGDVPSADNITNSHTGTTVYGSATLTYACVKGGSETRLYGANNTLYAGGSAPELLVGKNTGSFTVSGIPNGGASEITVSYKQNNKALTVAASGTGYSGSATNTPASATTESFDVTVGSDATFTLTFTPSTDNVRIDDISVKVKTQGITYEDPKVECICSADPVAGTAAVDAEGTFSASSIAVKATGASTGHADCSYTDYGFVWSSSVSASAELKLVEGTGAAADNCTKVPVGTDGQVTTFAGSITGSFTANNPIYVRSYVKNGKAAGTYQYSSVVTITPRSVTFNLNGHGSSTPAAQFVNNGNKVTDPSYTEIVTGYIFGGWYKEVGCTNQWNFATDVVSGESKTLYAKWTPISYFVRFNNNDKNYLGDATGLMDNESYHYDENKALTANRFSLAGYDFAGWATTADGSVAHSDEAVVGNLSSTNREIVDLYAIWSPKNYDVTLAATNETSSVGEQVVTATYNDAMPTTKKGSGDVVAPSRTGYTFTGWEYSSTTYYNYNAGTSTLSSAHVWDQPNSTTTLTPKWSINSYTLTWDLAGGTVSVEGTGAAEGATGTPSSSVVYNSAITVPTVTKAGYNFAGWDVTPAKNMPASDVTYTATWTPKTLTSISLAPSSGEVYVGQYADFTVSYDPADYISPGYSLNATPVYVAKESAAPANTKLRLKGGRGSGPGASITETVIETVTIKASGDNTKTASVEITVNPLPRVHFVDNIHNESFSDVVATISENALVATKTTPTHADVANPSSASSCENTHLHLVGWIRGDWPAYVAYMNGTGAAPTVSELTSAGTGYWFTPNADINVETYNGKTFYAVWAVEE